MIWSPTEIKERRERLGLTQAELAARVDASRRAVLDWEAGKSRPQGRFYARLVAVLDPSSDDSSPSDGPLLKDASFVETINHLVSLYQEAQRGSIMPGLRVEHDPLPANFADAHHVTTSPKREREADDAERPGQGDITDTPATR